MARQLAAGSALSRVWSGQRIVLTLALAALTPTLAAQAVHPRVASREKAIRSFVVLPPRIEIARGSDEVNAFSRAAWARTLGSTAEEGIKEAGREVTRVLSEDKLKDGPELAAVEALQKRWDMLLPKVSAKPKDVGKGSFSLGGDVQQLDSAPADALVFTRASLRSKSEVGEAKMTATSLSISITYTFDVKVTHAIVDARTGDVLYFFPAQGKGERNRAEEELKRAVATALRKLPQ